MSKPIHEIFPDCTRRVRRARGVAANVELRSFPSTRSFFEAVADKLVYYEGVEIQHDGRYCGDTTLNVNAFYHDFGHEHTRYGFLKWTCCCCPSCGGLGLERCKDGTDLHNLTLSMERRIAWYPGLDLFLANLHRHTKNMEVITQIIDYLYPYEEDSKPAMIFQRKMIEQQRQIAVERAEERNRTYANLRYNIGLDEPVSRPPTPPVTPPTNERGLAPGEQFFMSGDLSGGSSSGVIVVDGEPARFVARDTSTFAERIRESLRQIMEPDGTLMPQAVVETMPRAIVETNNLTNQTTASDTGTLYNALVELSGDPSDPEPRQ